MHSFDKKEFVFFIKCVVVIALIFWGIQTVASKAFSWYFTPKDLIEKIGDALSPNIKPPQVSARAYLIADLETGKVYLEKNKNVVSSPASLIKLLTALTAYESIPLTQKIPITERVLATYGDSSHFKAGEELRLNDILYPLLLESSNDAAEAIAEYYDREDFIALMNTKARVIGMKKSSFVDPAGLSDRNSTTAEDLFLLTRHLTQKKPELLKITTIDEKRLPSPINRTVYNHNFFNKDARFIGGKTGYTDGAKETMIAIFDLPVKGEKKNRTIVFIVLGSSDREADIGKLLGWFNEVVK